MSKTYPFRGRAVDVLSDVDFSAHAGELTAIVGHSGTGKSTLLHILGLLTEPDRGSVVVDGTDTSGLGDGELADLRRAKMGFVFQSYNLLPQHSALRNTLIPSVRRGRRPRTGPGSCWSGSASGSGWTTSRPSCRAVSSSAWPWPAPWSTTRR